ncbi:MAG: carboxypeptidase regulatory-like domain-containing protein [Rhodopirellula sp. JB055]|uniref:carboxypeptidase regulatory-like domain-containing protein n=1 Tax=Rhodopirellula sp. JB055 TaxID=3342846 RepID=UPI00370ACA70
MSWFLRSAIGLGLLLMLGCVSQDSSKLGKVTGTVFQNGQPVPNLALEFHPVSGGRPSLAFTNDSGHFEAIYLANVPGAKIGDHTMRYEMTPGKLASDISPAEMLTIERPSIPYGAVLDPLQVTVARGSNHFEFNLITPPPAPEQPSVPNAGTEVRTFVEPAPNADNTEPKEATVIQTMVEATTTE